MKRWPSAANAISVVLQKLLHGDGWPPTSICSSVFPRARTCRPSSSPRPSSTRCPVDRCGSRAASCTCPCPTSARPCRFDRQRSPGRPCRRAAADRPGRCDRRPPTTPCPSPSRPATARARQSAPRPSAASDRSAAGSSARRSAPPSGRARRGSPSWDSAPPGARRPRRSAAAGSACSRTYHKCLARSARRILPSGGSSRRSTGAP